MSHHDVIVLGLGSMGSAAALQLASRGQRVLGLERFGAGHEQGSHHGDSRVIRQSYFEDPAYVPLLLRAYELWDQLEADTGADLITLTGGLFFGPEDSTVVAGSLASARAWDLPHDALTGPEIAARFPTMRPAPGDVGLWEARGGFVRPERTVAAQCALAARRGAELHFDSPALAWSADAGGVTVRTAEATHHADRLVIAPGAWAPELLADLGVGLQVTRQLLFWFTPKAGPERFAVGRHPVYVHEDAGGRQVYGFPGIDGPDGPVKVAFFRLGEPTTVQSIDRTVAPAEIEEMRGAAGAFVPDLPGALSRSTVCMYTNTPDEHFVIATHPEHERVVVACGFSGHGFKFVPVIGELLADLVIDGRTEHPIALFDPRREALHA